MIRSFILTLDAQYRTDYEQEWYGAIMQAIIALLTVCNRSMDAPEPTMRGAPGGGPGQGGHHAPGSQGSRGTQPPGASYPKSSPNGGGKGNYGNKGVNGGKKSQHKHMEDTEDSSYESLEKETVDCYQEENEDTSAHT